MRVTIRQALHPYLQVKANQLGIDIAETVNYLLLQLLDNSSSVQPTAPNKTLSTTSAPVPVVQASEPTARYEPIDPTIARIAKLIDTF